MILKPLSFISFSSEQEKFRGSLSLEVAFNTENDPQALIKKSEVVYGKHIQRMRLIIQDLREMKINHMRIPASKIWLLGDNIFTLKKDLENISLQIDDLYKHLARDLGVKRKWLEKVVILRRYISDKRFIPKGIHWGVFEHSTARKARDLERSK